MRRNMPIIKAISIPSNRFDIILHKKQENTCLMTVISVPDDASILGRENEKISKYKDLQIDISIKWKCKTTVVLLIVGQ